jgi:hypothetical protein
MRGGKKTPKITFPESDEFSTFRRTMCGGHERTTDFSACGRQNSGIGSHERKTPQKWPEVMAFWDFQNCFSKNIGQKYIFVQLLADRP